MAQFGNCLQSLRSSMVNLGESLALGGIASDPFPSYLPAEVRIGERLLREKVTTRLIVLILNRQLRQKIGLATSPLLAFLVYCVVIRLYSLRITMQETSVQLIS